MKLSILFSFLTFVVLGVTSQAQSLREENSSSNSESQQSLKSLNEDSVQPEAKIDYRLLPLFNNTNVSVDDRKRLIESQIDPRQRSNLAPIQKVESRKHKTQDILSEGTGTRGGGSGIAIKSASAKLSVQLLDIYRSERLAEHPKFFEIDPEFKRISQDLPASEARAKIFALMMSRLKTKMPHLTKKLETAALAMPFEKWTAAISKFPLLPDYIGQISLQPNEAHVQIAYRRNNQIIYNEEYFLAMDGLNRAALQLHEYIYAISNQDHSAKVQRFVSLAFSPYLFQLKTDTELEQLLLDLNVLGLAMKTPALQNGATVTSELRGRNESCGKLASMTADVPTKTVKLHLKIENQLIAVDLDSEFMKTFLISFYAAKAFLDAQFPSSLYPAQQLMQDVICVDRFSGKPSSFELVTVYDPVKSAAELKAAQLEARYFSIQKTFVKSKRALDLAKPQTMEHLTLLSDWNDRYKEFIHIEHQIRMHQITQMSESHPYLAVMRSKTLGQMRVKFLD